MRIYKFRRWDSAHKRMMEFRDISVLLKNVNNVSGTKQFHTMEWVGIQDCNGNDIYEGDIIKVSIKGGNIYSGPVTFFPKYGIFGIAMWKRFKHLAADPQMPLGSSGYSTPYRPYNWTSYKRIEVVGNIFETKADLGWDK